MKPINYFIDHTLLKIDATPEDYINHCFEAKKNNFFSVCVPPQFVSLAHDRLQDSDTKVCSVISFPAGFNLLDIKIQECQHLLKMGADEIDMVANFSNIKAHNWQNLFTEVQTIKAVCANINLKVIVESSLLSKYEILNCCLTLIAAGADYIKTSTGFNGPGANLSDVVYMKKICSGTNLKIKASGGIRNLKTANSFIDAGCDRLGTSSSLTIMKQLKTGSTDDTSASSNY